MPEKNDFRPCPFCGSRNIKFDKCTMRVMCKGCFAKSGMISKYVNDGMSEEAAAITAWNTRFTEEEENVLQ